MQRQYAQLEKYPKKHDDALKKLSDDKDGAIQRLSGDIQNVNNSMQKYSNDIKMLNKKINYNSFIYTCIFVIFMPVSIIAYHHYWSPSQKMPSNI